MENLSISTEPLIKSEENNKIQQILNSLYDHDKADLTESLLNEKDYNLDLDDLKKILSTIKESHNKGKIILSWLKKESNNLSLQDLENILIKIQNDSYEKAIINSYFKKEINNYEFDSLKEILKTIQYDSRKHYIVISWLNKEGNNLDSQNLKKILEMIQGDSYKKDIILSWLEKEGNNFKFEELEGILETIKDDYCKREITLSWLKKEGNNFDLDDLKEILKTIQDDSCKREITLSWLKKEDNNLSFKELEGILETVQNDSCKKEIIAPWLNKQNAINDNNLENNLILILQKKNLFDIYDFTQLFRFIAKIEPQSAKIKAINYIGGSIYNNDYIKKEFYLEAISEDHIRNSKELFDSGFSEIKTDDIYLDILEAAKQREIIDNIKLLDYLKGKKASKFSSLQHLIDKNSNLEQSKIFINNGLEALKSWFAGNNLNNNFDITKYNLNDIINYAYFNNDLVKLTSILQPEFLKELQESYKPNDSKINNQREIDKMASFIGLAPSEIEKKLVRISDIAGKFKDLFNDIKKAEIEDVSNSKLIDEDIKKILSKAINKENINDEEIKSFYKIITGTKNEINQDNISKLSSFINGNIDLLCYILAKDDGLATLSGVMSSLNDGCVANIANQLNNIAISFLLKDQEKKQNNDPNLTEQQKQEKKQKNTALTILYQALSTDIIPTVTKYGGDILGSSSNASLIKDSTPLNKLYISPNLLFQYLKNNIEIKNDYSYMLSEDEQKKMLGIMDNIDDLNIADKDLKKEIDEVVNEEYKKAIVNKVIEITMGKEYIEYKDLFGSELQQKINNILQPNNQVNSTNHLQLNQQSQQK